ncbi:MAG: cytidine deaminase, partial [Myxococcales bacterium]|nr:cytidine deaminase [Myxococcales bacterium]
ENASYGLCLCAERSAVAQAVAAGATAFEAIAIVAPGDRPVPPCGMCRQVLAEFSPAMTVRSYTEGGAMLESSVAELLPHGFSSDFLE